MFELKLRSGGSVLSFPLLHLLILSSLSETTGKTQVRSEKFEVKRHVLPDFSTENVMSVFAKDNEFYFFSLLS